MMSANPNDRARRIDDFILLFPQVVDQDQFWRVNSRATSHSCRRSVHASTGWPRFVIPKPALMPSYTCSSAGLPAAFQAANNARQPFVTLKCLAPTATNSGGASAGTLTSCSDGP